MPTVKSLGHSIHYEEAGSGFPTLLLHGWGASERMWASTRNRLARNFRVLVPDLLGHGKSDTPPGFAPYTIEYQMRMVRGFLDALDLPRVHLIGHSMGGMIAATTALVLGHRVASLVLVNAPVHGPTALFQRGRMLMLPGVRHLAVLLSEVRALRNLFAADFTFARPLPQDLIDQILDVPYDAQVGGLLALAHTDLAPRLGEIACPTLVVHSDRDRVIRAEQFAVARERIPGARSAFLGETGHCPMVERPEIFERDVEDFLTGPASGVEGSGAVAAAAVAAVGAAGAAAPVGAVAGVKA
ncbi:MAG: alpha/beta fold hydrolase [Planctomycetes bacterium]|nr:alpha/beta fold hydrolase [Planctomycetota bacterium]